MLTLEVLQLGWAGDEPHIAALLHQTAYPPVIVEFLHTAKTSKAMSFTVQMYSF